MSALAAAARPRARIADELRAAPVTYAYFAILCVTTLVLVELGARLADRVLLAQSTNLDHLARDPLRVLVGSAFWLSSASGLAVTAAWFAFVLAPAERRLGSRRTVEIFAVGHVGATLVTAAGLWVALRFDAVERSVVHARDVGVSYGLFAVAGALTSTLAPSVRRRYASLLVATLVGIFAVAPSFTNAGHAVALLLGLACTPLLARAASSAVEVAT